MSEKAKRLIQEAIEEYRSESGDGATRQGSYQDAITDVLHLAHDDELLRAAQANPCGSDWISWLYTILSPSGTSMFEEERQMQELEEVNAIPVKDLPVYIGHDWEFDSSGIRVAERLKEGK